MRDRIAEITTWSNNCSISCISIFLAQNLLNRTLNESDSMKLVEIMNRAYGTEMHSIGEMRILLENHKHPCDQQKIIGCALRHHLSLQGIQGDAENMLGDEIFTVFSGHFTFNIEMNLVDNDCNLVLNYFIGGEKDNTTLKLSIVQKINHLHFDILMNTAEEAQVFNASSASLSDYSLPEDMSGIGTFIKDELERSFLDRVRP